MTYTKDAVLSLYRNLIRETKKWKSYNYRMYALRRIQYDFHENKCLQDKAEIEQCYKRGMETLELIKRQVVIGDMYASRPLIIETRKKKESIAH